MPFSPKKYTRRKFKARHPDFADVEAAIVYAYEQGLKDGQDKPVIDEKADHTGQQPQLVSR